MGSSGGTTEAIMKEQFSSSLPATPRTHTSVWHAHPDTHTPVLREYSVCIGRLNRVCVCREYSVCVGHMHATDCQRVQGKY
eukprot:3494278-Rhodomonas_salina.1